MKDQPHEPLATRIVDAVMRDLTEARRVLRLVEWGNGSHNYCRACQCWHFEGHASDCALAAVLAQEEEEK